MKKRLLFPGFLVLALFSACGGLRLQEYPREPCEKTPGPASLALIENRCALCHKGDFAKPQDICERKMRIMDAVVSGRMPRFSSLSPEELQILADWTR